MRVPSPPSAPVRPRQLLRGLVAIGGLVALASTACGGNGDIGSSCSSVSDCGDGLQCVDHACTPRCDHATDCGDGYQCDDDGLCVAGAKQAGDGCGAEAECAAGLACHLDQADTDHDGVLLASCGPDVQGHALGSTCDGDAECRNGTCALGHCVDVCATSRDCADGMVCTQLPRVEATGAMFGGCVPSTGTLTWSIPAAGPSSNVALPVPGNASSIELLMEIDDDGQQVGATLIKAPNGDELYRLPTSPAEFYANPVRHQPLFGSSALLLPQRPELPLVAGAYDVEVASLKSNGSLGTAVPRLTAIAKLDRGSLLDLHFYFLDLSEHPCRAEFGDDVLDAAHAATSTVFKDTYVKALRQILAQGQIAINTITYTDITDHADLDGLNVDDAGRLFELSTTTTGINVFFVRTLAPDGVQAIAPIPGAIGLAGRRSSGIAVSVDSLCYRSWDDLARLTAHELARYMGLYDNRDIDGGSDPIGDTADDADNLMYFSEQGGTGLTAGQRYVLTRSGVLQ